MVDDVDEHWGAARYHVFTKPIHPTRTFVPRMFRKLGAWFSPRKTKHKKNTFRDANGR